MKNKTKIIITFVILIIVLVVVFLFLNKKSSSDVKVQENTLKYVKKYMDDTGRDEVSVKALLENGYMENTDEDECNIYNKEDITIKKLKNDCDMALELAKMPVIEVEGQNVWHNTEQVFTVKLKNGGNKYYQEKDIKNVTWYSFDDDLNMESRTLSVGNDARNVPVTVLISFGDAEFEHTFNVLIDKEAPVLVNKILDDAIVAEYDDAAGVSNIYYYASTDEVAPSKNMMIENINDELTCDKEYNVWAYAKDYAGNESDISYLGKYIKCNIENKSVTVEGKGR